MLRALMKTSRAFLFSIVAAAVFAATGCGWMPKVKMPFTRDSPAEGDPKAPFDVRRPLSHGDTLKLAVYRNFLSPSREFEGTVMVDRKGLIHFKKAGDVRVGGRKVYDAVKAIEAAFSREYGDSTITVQLFSVEDVPLVTVKGAVHSAGVIQWFGGMSADAALPYVGGRTGHGDACAVHVTRDGARRFHANSVGVPLEAGDLVNFSRDI